MISYQGKDIEKIFDSLFEESDLTLGGRLLTKKELFLFKSNIDSIINIIKYTKQ